MFTEKCIDFIESCIDKKTGAYSSSYNGQNTLYGTCYALMTQYYLGYTPNCVDQSINFILTCQDETTGYFIGPELIGFQPPNSSPHSYQHILRHTLVTVLPTLKLYGVLPKYKLIREHDFCDLKYLSNWLDNTNWRDPWLEGNNLLFTGQCLIYLRDTVHINSAGSALKLLFDWLDERIEPSSGLWASSEAGIRAAIYGGYHQLLLYYYENHPTKFPQQLTDSVLSIYKPKRGFSTRNGGGACEDVDGVDILVNMYKRYDYRRPEIRYVLRNILSLILNQQNSDGGFPYNPNSNLVHLGIPATASGVGESNMFPTWFRIHTLALISEILTDEPILMHQHFRFNNSLSMGWHKEWSKESHPIKFGERINEIQFSVKFGFRKYFVSSKNHLEKILAGIRMFIQGIQGRK